MSDAAQTITLQELFNRNWQTFVIDGYDPCGSIFVSKDEKGRTYMACCYRKEYINDLLMDGCLGTTRAPNNPACACAVGLGIPDTMIAEHMVGAVANLPKEIKSYFSSCGISVDDLTLLQRIHDFAYNAVHILGQFETYSEYFRARLTAFAKRLNLNIPNGRQL